MFVFSWLKIFCHLVIFHIGILVDKLKQIFLMFPFLDSGINTYYEEILALILY